MNRRRVHTQSLIVAVRHYRVEVETCVVSLFSSWLGKSETINRRPALPVRQSLPRTTRRKYKGWRIIHRGPAWIQTESTRERFWWCVVLCESHVKCRVI